MRNQTTKSHNAKSKILLITLCIFGLLFSYSCQCKNNVSDPNNIPPDSGIKTNDIIPDTGDTDPDKDLVDGALSTTSTKVIVVAGAGDTVKTISTIKFKNATATLTAIADVDASANTPTDLTLDDFDYTGTTLTFKKDTTDASKYDATTLAKVSWSGVDTKKVKATFSLTPTSENVSLTTTTQDVEIEIGKVLILSTKEIFSKENLGDSLQHQQNSHTFMFKLGSLSADGLTFTVKDTNGDRETIGGDVSINDFKETVSTRFASNSEYFKNYFDSINWVSQRTENYTPNGKAEKVNGKLILKVKFNLKPISLVEFDDTEYTIEALMEGTGNWV